MKTYSFSKLPPINVTPTPQHRFTITEVTLSARRSRLNLLLHTLGVMTDLLAGIELDELNDSKLAWSSIEYLDRVYNPTRKRGAGRSIAKCLFCGSEWKSGGPRDIRAHLDPGAARHRAVCIPIYWSIRFHFIDAID